MNTSTPPKKKFVSVDWDKVFEHPETGLITVINQAKSTKSLHRCSHIIVETLFNRDGDEERRHAFATVVNDIVDHTSKASKSDAVALAAAKTKIAQVLGSIKQDRQKRAHMAQKAFERDNDNKAVRTKELEIVESKPQKPKTDNTDNQEDETSWKLTSDAPENASAQEPEKPIEVTEDTEAGEVEEEEKTLGGYKLGTAEAFFIQAISQSILERMAVLRGKSINRSKFPDGIPFILSAEFAEHFGDVISHKILPQLVSGCYVMINRMSVLPKDKWQEYLETVLADRSDRVILWERWQIAWLESTTKTDYPPKPENKSSKPKGAIRKFFEKMAEDDHYDDDDDGEMTMEEWKEAAKLIKQENLEAKNNWEAICEPSDAYIAPIHDDNRLLLEIFGHDPEIFSNDINELEKLASRESGKSRAFEEIQRGNNLDLPLLSLCYTSPQTMLLDGDTVLSSFVSGLDKNWRKETLPLTTRYLSDKMIRVSAD
ncbi:MAG: hypothetical protein HON65_03215 [Rhodospirillales bacterium]|nr:hypothetical protein [Rhodospirillales bacterium]